MTFSIIKRSLYDVSSHHNKVNVLITAKRRKERSQISINRSTGITIGIFIMCKKGRQVQSLPVVFSCKKEDSHEQTRTQSSLQPYH